MRRLLAGAFVLATSTLFGPPAVADDVDPGTRQAARILGEEGDAFYDGARYREALDRYRKALALIDVPTLRLREAFCLEQLGRWVEAAEAHRAIARRELPADAPPEHREALAIAAETHERLSARIPFLVVEAPQPHGDLTVMLDGRPFHTVMLGEKQPVDPGRHRLDAQRGAARFAREVDVPERSTVRVRIELPVAPPPSTSPPPPPTVPLPPPPPPAPADEGAPMWGLGWAALGVGLVGVATGAVAAGVAAGDRAELETACGPDLACPPAMHEEADAYNRLRIVSTVGFSVGAPLLVTGAVLLVVFAPRSNETGVGAWISPGQAGLRGRF